MWIVEDITDRRRHADEVARLLREQEAILGTASVGIVFVKDRRIVRCNRRYEEMYGYGPGELRRQADLGALRRTRRTSTRPATPTSSCARGQHRAPRRAAPAQGRQRVLGPRRRARGRSAATRSRGSVWTVEDVTEQRRAEEELQRVLAEQQALLDNVVVGIAFSRDRKVVRCNRRFEEMFGFAARRGDRRLLARSMYFTEEEFEMRGQVYAELDQGRTHAREQWLRRQDGSGFWCRVAGRAVAAGDPARGYVWLIEDISERRRADEALERLVREQDAVLQNARHRHHLRQGPQDRALQPALRGDLRLRRGRAAQPARRASCSPPTRSTRPAASRSTSRCGAARRVYTRARATCARTARVIWCSLSGRAVQPGDPAQGSVWLFDDITQEHEAEERVQRALAEQELILDNASVGIAFVRNRAIQRCNRFLEDMVGAGPGELIGQSTAMLFASHEDWERGRAAPTTPRRPAAPRRRGALQARDGTTFLCRTRGRRTDTGEAEQEWIWSYEDVTAEREAEKRVQRALAEQDLILDNATVGIAFVRNRVIQRCNRFLEEMCGATPRRAGRPALVDAVRERG